MIHASNEKIRSQFRVIYDGDSFIDGVYCDEFDEAQFIAMSILESWVESSVYMSDEEWNYFVYNASVWVEQWCEDAGEYIECWSPADEVLENIGFIERGE